jgi:hypothetical protein
MPKFALRHFMKSHKIQYRQIYLPALAEKTGQSVDEFLNSGKSSESGPMDVFINSKQGSKV